MRPRLTISRRLAPFALAAAGALGIASVAAGHGDPAVEVAGLTRMLRAQPGNVKLLARRAELNLAAGWWAPAIEDHQALVKIDPANNAWALGLGRALLGAGRFLEAEAAFTRLLERIPGATIALESRAQARAKQGRAREAAADYTQAIELGAAGADQYLERARALATLGDEGIDEALRGLDEGMAKTGPIPALSGLAIDLEIKRGRADAALKRLAAIEPKSGRKDAWLGRRGEALEAAGDRAAAREAYSEALAEIERLPVERRRTQMTLDFEAKLRGAIARIDAGAPPEGKNAR